MTRQFETMMYLFQCAARGKTVNIDKLSIEDLKQIRLLAQQQQIWSMIYMMLINHSNIKEFFSSNDINNCENNILYTATKKYQGKMFLDNILKKFIKNDIDAILLKGETLAELYKYPELRFSGDIDLLIRKEDEKKALEILIDNDFEIINRLNTEHDTKCIHKMLGVLELHVSLYDDYCEDIWFNGINSIEEKPVKFITSDGFEYTVLGYTDQLLFITLHFIKHFLSSGAGIRQLMDVLLYVETYGDKTDKTRYVSIMQHLKYDYFMDICMYIGENYLGSDKSKLIYINGVADYSDEAQIVLNSIEQTGLFGHNDLSFRQFHKLYTKERYNATFPGDYRSYIKNRKSKNSLLKIIFLDKNRLQEKYTYLRKHKYLIPIAWIHRCIRALFKLLKKEKIQEPMLSNIEYNQKLEMLNKLRMI